MIKKNQICKVYFLSSEAQNRGYLLIYRGLFNLTLRHLRIYGALVFFFLDQNSNKPISAKPRGGSSRVLSLMQHMEKKRQKRKRLKNNCTVITRVSFFVQTAHRVWLCVRAYLPAYAANDALAPLVETSLVLDPHSTHCNCFRDSGRGLVSPTSVRYHLIVVWVVVSVLVCLP